MPQNFPTMKEIIWQSSEVSEWVTCALLDFFLIKKKIQVKKISEIHEKIQYRYF